ncbi:acyl-CoA dehydrogenase family protein, partial [Spirillospora sp. NPDC049652]
MTIAPSTDHATGAAGPAARADLVAAAAALAPALADRAAWNDEHRRLHDDTVRALSEAGFFRLRLPARYGGLEADARTVVDVLAE